MRDMRVAVLIPCWNEAQTIGKVVHDFRAALPGADVYVYDNNSTDGTAQAASAAGAIVRKEPVQGKGAVVRRMFREIEADVYVMADGDDTYPAESAQALVDAVWHGGADMAVGDRLSTTYSSENKRRFHDFGNKLVRLAVRCLFSNVTNDIMTGYRAFSRQFVKTFPVLSDGFEIETEMTVHAADRRMHVVDVPVQYRDRPEGSESKLNTFRDGAKVLLAIAHLFRKVRPMRFFGGASLLLLAAAMCLFFPVLAEYLDTGLVDRFPTLIVSGFLAVAAIQLFACGAVLETLRDRDRREFEFQLHQATWSRPCDKG